MIRYAIEHLRSWKKGLSFILFRFPSGHDWRREEKTRKIPFSPFSQCHSSGGVAYFFPVSLSLRPFLLLRAPAYLWLCTVFFIWPPAFTVLPPILAPFYYGIQLRKSGSVCGTAHLGENGAWRACFWFFFSPSCV